MRIAITGATGNVGTSLIEVLSTDDRVDRIVGIARRRPDWDPGKTMWIEADVATDDLREAIEGCDALVHLAWLMQPSRDEATLSRTNVEGSRRVFEAAAAAGVRSLIYASSVGAYSPGPGDDPVDETWPTNGVASSVYSRQKAAVEGILDAFEESHPDVRVVRMRPHLTFKRESASAQRRLMMGPLLPSVVIRRRLIPFVPHTPSLRFQALHSIDAAEAYRLALFAESRGAFNIAADPVLTTADIAALLKAWTVPVPPPLLHGALMAAYKLHVVPMEPGWFDLGRSLPLLDSSRARDELGWEPRYTGRDALAELLEGIGSKAGKETPPLDPQAGGPARAKEFTTGVGEK